MLVEWRALRFLGVVSITRDRELLQARMFCVRGHILVLGGLTVP